MVGWYLEKWFFPPKMVVKPWGFENFMGNEDNDWFCDLLFGNIGHRTAHKVKATMKVDTPPYEGPTLHDEGWTEKEGKMKTFVLFSEEEIPPTKVDRGFKTLRLIFHEGSGTFSVVRLVAHQDSDGVLESREAPEEFPARDTFIEITLEGENLREKDLAIRQFKVEFPDPETGEPPSASGPVRLLVMEPTAV